jgi:PAS domain S-box-containing protein
VKSLDLAKFFDASPELMCVFGPDGKFRRINPAGTRILGYAEAELVGRPSLELLHPEDQGATAAALCRLAGGEDGLAIENRWICRDGTARWLAWTFTSQGESVIAFARDISAAKRAESDLRQANERMSFLLAEAPVVLFVFDAQGKIQLSSGKGLDRIGRKRDDSVGRNVLDMYRDSPGVQSAFARALAGEAASVAIPVGDALFEASMAPILDASGAVREVIGISVDQTARAHAEREILRLKGQQLQVEADRRIRETLDNMGVGVAVTEVDGRIITVNEELGIALGVNMEDLTGVDYPAMLGLAGSIEMAEDLRALGAAESRKFAREVEFRRPDGQVIYLLLTVSGIRRPDSSLRSLIFVHKDITARKAAEISLQRALKDLSDSRFALDQSSILANTDAVGRLTYVNDKFCEISQYSRAELIGKTHQIINARHHPREFFDDLWSTISGGRIWRGEIMNRAKDGSFYWVYTVIVPLLGDDGRPYQYTAIRSDITERKRTEEERAELLTRERAAIEASRLKSEFLANMSHEIRTPLNGVVGMSRLLKTTSLDETQAEYADTIIQSADNLLALVNDILDLSKIEAGKLELERVEFDPRQLVLDVRRTLSPMAAAKSIRLETDITLDGELSYLGDVARLRQVLFNLVQNAIKFTAHGHVRLRLSRSGTTFRFAVEDTGIGIEPAAAQKIFAPFVQADASTTRRFGGTGLGLSICKRLVQLMDGRIGVESHLGEGSVFWFEVPLQPGLPLRAPELEPPARSIVPASRIRARILIAEDNLINQKVIRRFVESLGHQSVIVANGVEALARLEAQPGDEFFDLVLMDCHMPEMDGFTAAQRIRGHARPEIAALPIIALTADVLRSTREKCFAAGMSEYIRKPIDPGELARAIDAVTLPALPPPVALDETAIARLRLLNAPGLPDIIAELVEDFVRDTPAQIEAIHEALIGRDAVSLRDRAHSLKSTAALLGVSSLSGTCAALEDLAAGGGLEGAVVLVARLKPEMDGSVPLLLELSSARAL